VEPAGEDLHRDRFRLGRSDQVKVLALERADGITERGLDDVEVADHPALVEGCSLDDDVDTVVVRVEISFRRREPRDAVKRPQRRRRADLEAAAHE
jgi:hypothetical protein